MIKFRANILPLFCFLIAITVITSYHFFFKAEIVALLDGKTSSWSTQIIHWVYPRLSVEQHRFTTSFFLEKTAMVFYRGTGVFIFLGTFCFVLINNPWLAKKWNCFWEQDTNRRGNQILNRLYILFVLFFTRDLIWDIVDLQAAALFFYKPVFIHKILGLGFSSIPWSVLLVGLFYLSLIASFFDKLRNWTFLFAMLLFVYFEGLLNGFEKLDHGFATFFYAGFGLVISNFVSRPSSTKVFPKWPILLIQLWVCLSYFLAGLEKLTISGVNWMFSVHSIQSHLVALPTPLGLLVSESVFLCWIIMVFTISLQFGFISVLFNKKLVLPILLIGVSFHWGTTLLLGINQYINPWIAAYIFFIDWSTISIFQKIRN
jgi:hypothetical protein